MPVTGLNHVNIRTTDPAASAQFYVDVFDFEYRLGPLVMGHQPHWLYDQQGAPIIHLRTLEADSTSTGPIDHVAISCEGKAEILRRLEARGVKYAMTDNAIPGVTQVFIVDPHGVPLELNFAGE